MWKSILAVAAGYGVIAVLTMGFFAILATLSVMRTDGESQTTPSTGVLVAILAWGVVSAASGGWLTCHLAPGTPQNHLWGLMGFIALTSLGCMFASNGPPVPNWYAWGLLAVGIGGAFLGGRLKLATLP